MKKIFLTVVAFLLLAIAFPPSKAYSADFLDKANQEFLNKNFKLALLYYHLALEDFHFAVAQEMALSSGDFRKDDWKKPEPDTKNSSKGQIDAYIYFSMGECHVELNEIDQAIEDFSKGAASGGNTDIGNQCLFEAAFYSLLNNDNPTAYDLFGKYVKRLGTDPSTYDVPRASMSMYYYMISGWLQKSILKTFLAMQASTSKLPLTDKPLSFQ